MIDNAEDFDVAMRMYNLLAYIHKYFVTSGSFWNYYRDNIDDVNVNNSASDGKSIEHKTKLVRETLEIPPQPENPGHTDQAAQQPVPPLTV